MTEQVSAESISDILLSEAKKQGAEAADVLVATGVSTSVDVRMGRLELSERAEGLMLACVFLLDRNKRLFRALMQK